MRLAINNNTFTIEIKVPSISLENLSVKLLSNLYETIKKIVFQDNKNNPISRATLKIYFENGFLLNLNIKNLIKYSTRWEFIAFLKENFIQNHPSESKSSLLFALDDRNLAKITSISIEIVFFFKPINK